MVGTDVIFEMVFPALARVWIIWGRISIVCDLTIWGHLVANTRLCVTEEMITSSTKAHHIEHACEPSVFALAAAI
jgi:hypothetical protein